MGVYAYILLTSVSSTSTEVVAYSNAQFGEAQLPILLDDVACTGSETRVVDCPYDTNTTDCSHSQDAGTRCHPSMLYNSNCNITIQRRTIYVGSSPTIETVVCEFKHCVHLHESYSPRFSTSYMLAVQLCHCHHAHYYSVLFPLSSAVPLDVALNTRIVGTANSGEVKYYNFPFHSSGITFRVDVEQGSVVAYASDVTEAPSTLRGNVWQIQTTSYDDLFLDPLPLGRAAESTVHVAVEGMHSSNSFVIGAVAGNATTSSEIINKCALVSHSSLCEQPELLQS